MTEDQITMILALCLLVWLLSPIIGEVVDALRDRKDRWLFMMPILVLLAVVGALLFFFGFLMSHETL